MKYDDEAFRSLAAIPYCCDNVCTETRLANALRCAVDEVESLRKRLESLIVEWKKEPSACDKGHHCDDEPGNGCGASSCFASELQGILEAAS